MSTSSNEEFSTLYSGYNYYPEYNIRDNWYDFVNSNNDVLNNGDLQQLFKTIIQYDNNIINIFKLVLVSIYDSWDSDDSDIDSYKNILFSILTYGNIHKLMTDENIFIFLDFFLILSDYEKYGYFKSFSHDKLTIIKQLEKEFIINYIKDEDYRTDALASINDFSEQHFNQLYLRYMDLTAITFPYFKQSFLSKNGIKLANCAFIDNAIKYELNNQHDDYHDDYIDEYHDDDNMDLDNLYDFIFDSDETFLKIIKKSKDALLIYNNEIYITQMFRFIISDYLYNIDQGIEFVYLKTLNYFCDIFKDGILSNNSLEFIHMICRAYNMNNFEDESMYFLLEHITRSDYVNTENEGKISLNFLKAYKKAYNIKKLKSLAKFFKKHNLTKDYENIKHKLDKKERSNKHTEDEEMEEEEERSDSKHTEEMEEEDIADIENKFKKYLKYKIEKMDDYNDMINFLEDKLGNYLQLLNGEYDYIERSIGKIFLQKFAHDKTILNNVFNEYIDDIENESIKNIIKYNEDLSFLKDLKDLKEKEAVKRERSKSYSSNEEIDDITNKFKRTRF